MKKLFLIVAALFVAVSFSACSDDDNNKINPDQIVGTWQITRQTGFSIGGEHEGKQDFDISYPIDDVNDDYGFYCTYTFGAGGTGTYKSYNYYENNELLDQWSLQYSISGKQLSIKEQPDTQAQAYEIKKLTNTQLVLFIKSEEDGFKEEMTMTYKKLWFILLM